VVTARDAALLAHIAVGGLRSTDLARHPGVASSTVSEAVQRLIKLGLIVVRPRPTDHRARELVLTAQGEAAISAQSVLDAGRVCEALGILSAAQHRTAVGGLWLLADAAAHATEVRKRP
jgi:DNA-binding MarR family transcriptional regulator